MRTKLLIGAGLAVALAGAMWLYQPSASAQGWGMMGGNGPGYGHMGGYGPGYGHMGGWGGGPGPGAGQWNCPAFGQANASGPGYGPGYHMRGWGGGYGPGMMQGYGYGPRNGPAYNRGDAQGNQTLNLTTDDVKARMENWLAVRGNARLKVGEVKEKDADSITADIVTKDNSVVERFIVDRHTGVISRDNS
jgi:hypothetical protein